MMACYRGISVISPWLASLAAFKSASPSSLTSTTSLASRVIDLGMRVCWACGPWTHERLHVCVYVEEIISVFTDPCQAQRSVEFLWYFLRMIPRPHIFSTHLSAAMKEWTSDNWTVQSKEQQKVQKDSSNAFSIYILYWQGRETRATLQI